MPRVVHFDIKADEPESLKTFYEKVFQWRFDKWDDPSGQIEYYLVKTGEDEPGIDGGLAKRMDPEDQLDVTIGVINIDQYIKKIEDNGGTITSSKMAIPGVGWILNFTDPQGNKYVLMEDDPNAY